MTKDYINYLKKYSAINSLFIDDFFGLYDNLTNNNDFVIDIEKNCHMVKK